MQPIKHEACPIEWRGKNKNIEHRTIVSSKTGAKAMTIWQQRIPRDCGAPMHIHPHEETITVLQGRIVARIGDERVEAGAGETIFMPAYIPHGTRSIGDETALVFVMFPVADVQFEYVQSSYNS